MNEDYKEQLTIEAVKNNETINDYDATIKEIQSEIDSLSSSLNAVQNSLNQGKIEDLQAKKEKIETEKKRYIESLVEKDLAILQNIANADEEINQILEEENKLKGRLTAINFTTNAVDLIGNKEIQDIQKQLNNLQKEKNHRLSILAENIEKQRRQKEDEKTELETMDKIKELIEKDTKKLNELQKELNKLEEHKNIEDYEKKKKNLISKIENLKNSINNKKEKLTKLQEKYGLDKEKLTTNPSEATTNNEVATNKEVEIDNDVATNNTDNNQKPSEIKDEPKKSEQSNTVNLGKKKNISWKTVAWIAAGLVAGTAVGLSVGPVGLVAVNVAAGLAKAGLRKAATKASEREQAEIQLPQKILSVEEPTNALKTAITKFKEYIKSEEGLKDISAGLTGFMIGTSIGKAIDAFAVNGISDTFMSSDDAITQANATPTDALTQSTPTDVLTNPNSDITIGNSIGDYNVSVGHDQATWAVSGTNVETLDGSIINSNNSIFHDFYVTDGNGTILQQISDPGISVQDLIDSGIDPSNIATNVTDVNGNAQGFVSYDELMTGITNGGKTI